MTELENIFHVLITFTKHLAETMSFISEQKSNFDQYKIPQSLVSMSPGHSNYRFQTPFTVDLQVEIEKLAEDHQHNFDNLKKVVGTLKTEASKVEVDVKNFEDKFPLIRVFVKGLSFRPYIEKLESGYENAWENRKTILTQEGKKIILSSKFEEFKSSLQDEIQVLENILNDLSREDDSIQPQKIQDILTKSNIAKLRETAVIYHELDTKGLIFDMFRKYDNLHEKCCVRLTARKEFEAILVEMSLKLAEMKRSLQEWQKHGDKVDLVANEILKMQTLLKKHL